MTFAAVAILPAIAVLIASWVLVIGPRNADRTAAEADTTRTSDELRSAQVQLGNARNFADDGERAVTRLAELRRLLPESPDVGGFVTLNEDAARSNGVQILSLVPEQPDTDADEGFVLDDEGSEDTVEGEVPRLGSDVSAFEEVDSPTDSGGSVTLPDGVERVPVTVSARGPDDRITGYIASLTSMPRLVLIDEVSTVAEGDGNTSATLRLSVLYSPP
ncbi:MAG: hypothetical protein R2696_10825 [Microthrixaceae bacterium]